MMKIRYKLGLWISICSLLAVCCSRPINIDVTNFEVDTVPLPDDWIEERRGSWVSKRDGQPFWQQEWSLPNANTFPFAGFSFQVSKFVSTNQAKRGYDRLDYRIRQTWVTDPRPEWSYQSDFADEYSMYCSGSNEAGLCHGIARYVNFVVIMTLSAEEGVTLEQVPTLFGLIDQHIQTVIESAGG